MKPPQLPGVANISRATTGVHVYMCMYLCFHWTPWVHQIFSGPSVWSGAVKITTGLPHCTDGLRSTSSAGWRLSAANTVLPFASGSLTRSSGWADTNLAPVQALAKSVSVHQSRLPFYRLVSGKPGEPGSPVVPFPPSTHLFCIILSFFSSPPEEVPSPKHHRCNILIVPFSSSLPSRGDMKCARAPTLVYQP